MRFARLIVPWVIPLIASSSARSDPANSPRFPYAFENPSTAYRDVLTLDRGARYIGKVLEFGTRVRIYDAGGAFREFPASAVRSFEMRRDSSLSNRPVAPDLTVACIRRGSPEAGAPVRWTIRVLNAGGAEAKPFDWSLMANDQPLASGRVDQPTASGQLRDIEVTIESGLVAEARECSVLLDLKRENTEAARWNNTFTEHNSNLPVTFIVPRSLRDEFAQVRNLVDTWCIEDWLQYHVQVMNELFRESRSTAHPGGIPARVRVADMVIFDSERPGAESEALDAARRTSPESAAVVLKGLQQGGRASDLASLVDWTLIHRIGLALGLPDPSPLECPVGQVLVRDASDEFVQRAYRLPADAGFMGSPGPRPFSDLDAFILARRSTSKAGETPGGLLPRNCGLKVLSAAGQPIAGVDVAIFQRRVTEQDGLAIPNEPIVIGETDPGGRFPLPVREGGSAWGKLAADGSDGVFLVRLRRHGVEEYHFVSTYEFMLAVARGASEAYDHPLMTHLAANASPAAPRFCRVKYDLEDPRYSQGFIIWPAAKSPDLFEYRVLARVGRAGPAWELVDLVAAGKIEGQFGTVTEPLLPLVDDRSNDADGTTFAIAAVDVRGATGPLTAPRYVPSPARDSMQLAVIPGSKPPIALISQAGPLRNGLIKSNINSLHDDFGIRTNRFPGYEPWGGGMAFDRRGRLVMTDPHNHQLAWYEQGQLVQLVGDPARSPQAASKKEGAFSSPTDVAVDDRDRLYVSDTGNHRIQEFDAGGNFVRIFKEADDPTGEGMFDRPTWLGFAHGHLCVTDLGGERVQIFDVTGDHPVRKRVFRNLTETNRALVGKSGRVYVLGRNEQGKDAVLIFPITPDERGEVPERSFDRTVQGRIRGPRGFYPDGQGNGLYTTAAPIQIQRCMLE